MIEDFGGIAKVMPVFAFAFVVVALSSIGLPGTNGFVGEFLILLGTFRTHPIAATIAATGVIFAAAYMLPMVQRILYGEVDREENRELSDIGLREKLTLAPALIMILLIGVYPGPFLTRTSASVDALIDQIEYRARRAPVDMTTTGDFRFDRMPILGVDETD
jgi:NADH-quinone oxidoreductase subunit M